MTADISADVIIIGSGISGALMGARLTAAGVKVAILEAGSPVDRSTAVENFWNAVIKVPECPYPPTPQAMHPISSDMDFWYKQAGKDKFQSTYLKQVGGTTWHWLGTCLRFLPRDFSLKTSYGRGVDWPISYNELEPFYGKAEQEIGVSGDSNEALGAPRSTAYPMPNIPQTYLDKHYVKALAGTKYQVRSTPQGRNSADRGQRPACCGNASCIPVCPVQAKYDATVHIGQFQKNGGALHAETTATFIEVGDQGIITGIRFRRRDNSEGRAVGQVYVLAAHAIETPRLLLNSRQPKAPNGVANRSDQVGRNLMDHPTQLSWALSNDPVWPYRGPLSTSGIENLRDGAFRRQRPAFRIEIGNDGWSWPTGAPVSTASDMANQGMTGKALDAELVRVTSRHIRLASLTEQLPDPENRVTLDPDTKDFYGVPVPRITYRLDDFTRAGLAAARRAHDDIFDRLGTTGTTHSPDFQGAGHIIGTARMGRDPRHSVVDRTLNCHDHPNMFILGSTVFPTSATGNPTLTIAALSLRAVASVKAALHS